MTSNEDDAGVGLKAAMLYSQLEASDACLKIVTTSNSDGILYVQLRIDPDSEETAVVKKVAHFIVDEDHQQFSGTEMRLSLPCPQDILELESVADTLTLYFQSLRYIAPPFVGVQFNFNVGEISTSVNCLHGEEPIDRFVADLGKSADDILYAIHDEEFFSISCVALMLGETELGNERDIEVSLLRFANHAPLINGDDFFLCGTTKGVSAAKLWRKYGFRCKKNTSHLTNQLVASPLRAATRLEDDGADTSHLVLAVDICVARSARDTGIKYGGLKKNTLDACYADGVETCCRAILQQLAETGRLCTPQQRQDHDLVENCAPLIAKSLAAIIKQSQVCQRGVVPSQLDRNPQDHFNEGLILQELQAAIRNCRKTCRLSERFASWRRTKRHPTIPELFMNLPTRIRQSGPVKGGINFAIKSWKNSGRWLWVLSTTLLVTLVPLSIEMLREEQTNEVVKELVSKGFSYNQIQGMGYMVSQPESTLAAPAEGSLQ
ncbi:hypothetical protein DD237_006099 [Peronospora effusa]|uniref:Uncharacterized protein n=1 Tax=Peronospora effusa TaxID=542832 RepID=A0A425C769_9STRA|nr:hypothetical protein DD237_006099 [Peronospora effusa]